MFIVNALLAIKSRSRSHQSTRIDADSSSMTLVEVQNNRNVPVTVYAQDSWGEGEVGRRPRRQHRNPPRPEPIRRARRRRRFLRSPEGPGGRGDRQRRSASRRAAWQYWSRRRKADRASVDAVSRDSVQRQSVLQRGDARWHRHFETYVPVTTHGTLRHPPRHRAARSRARPPAHRPPVVRLRFPVGFRPRRSRSRSTEPTASRASRRCSIARASSTTTRSVATTTRRSSSPRCASGATRTAAGKEALERMNWAHAHYKIANDDFLYVLSTFIYEPVRWIDAVGWRPTCANERLGYYYFWRAIGTRMGITDIPRVVRRVRGVGRAYEREQFRFTETNQRVGIGDARPVRVVVSARADTVRALRHLRDARRRDDLVVRLSQAAAGDASAAARRAQAARDAVRWFPPRRRGHFFTDNRNRTHPTRLRDLRARSAAPGRRGIAPPSERRTSGNSV